MAGHWGAGNQTGLSIMPLLREKGIDNDEHGYGNTIPHSFTGELVDRTGIFSLQWRMDWG
jgi:hypothetical protein